MKDDQGLFVVTVAMTVDGSRSDLLSMASVLHRRGVSVVEAELSRPAHERRVFSATFNATERQADTVSKSFANLIDVVDVALFRALDAREIHDEQAADPPHVLLAS